MGSEDIIPSIDMSLISGETLERLRAESGGESKELSEIMDEGIETCERILGFEPDEYDGDLLADVVAVNRLLNLMLNRDRVDDSVLELYLDGREDDGLLIVEKGLAPYVKGMLEGDDFYYVPIEDAKWLLKYNTANLIEDTIMKLMKFNGVYTKLIEKKQKGDFIATLFGIKTKMARLYLDSIKDWLNCYGMERYIFFIEGVFRAPAQEEPVIWEEDNPVSWYKRIASMGFCKVRCDMNCNDKLAFINKFNEDSDIYRA